MLRKIKCGLKNLGYGSKNEESCLSKCMLLGSLCDVFERVQFIRGLGSKCPLKFCIGFSSTIGQFKPFAQSSQPQDYISIF